MRRGRERERGQIMTEERLRRFRRYRIRHLTKGRRVFASGAEWQRYLSDLDAVKRWVAGLGDPGYDVAYYYWIRGLSCESVAMHVHYSERQVRRIRQRIMRSLEEQ